MDKILHVMMDRDERLTSWLPSQKLEPMCVDLEVHSNGQDDSYYRYIFEDDGYVVKQHFGWTPRLTIEDAWSDEILAETDGMHDNDHVKLAEKLMESAKDGKYVGRKTVEAIIYKIMVGDLKLVRTL